jgi:hypothetical protein
MDLTLSISFLVRKKKDSPEHALWYDKVTVNGRYKKIGLIHDIILEKSDQHAAKKQRTLASNQLVNRKIETSRIRLDNIDEELIKEEQI